MKKALHEKTRYSDSAIISILKQTEAGTPVPALCREHDIAARRSQAARQAWWWHVRRPAGPPEGLEEESRRLKK